MAENFSLIRSERAETTKHSPNSTRREMDVASATPFTPILGAPSQPKMNTAFSSTFRPTATLFSAVPTATRPILRRTLRYTSVTPQHR